MNDVCEIRRYRSDDRDADDNDLIIFQGGNLDWYLSIVKHGERIGPSVRITTSGAPANQPSAAVGAAALWRTLEENRHAEPPCLLQLYTSEELALELQRRERLIGKG